MAALACSHSLPLLDPGRPSSSVFARAHPSAFSPSAACAIERRDRAGARGPARARRPGALGSDALVRRAAGAPNTYHRPFDLVYSDVAQQRNLKKISSLFAQADGDASGTIDMAELQDAMKKPEIRKSFAAVGVQPHQAQSLFGAFDVDRDGSLSMEEFMQGLAIVTRTGADGTSVGLDFSPLKTPDCRRAMRAARRARTSAVQPPSPSGDAMPSTAPAELCGGDGSSSVRSSIHGLLSDYAPSSPSAGSATAPPLGAAKACGRAFSPRARYLGQARTAALFPAHASHGPCQVMGARRSSIGRARAASTSELSSA